MFRVCDFEHVAIVILSTEYRVGRGPDSRSTRIVPCPMDSSFPGLFFSIPDTYVLSEFLLLASKVKRRINEVLKLGKSSSGLYINIYILISDHGSNSRPFMSKTAN